MLPNGYSMGIPGNLLKQFCTWSDFSWRSNYSKNSLFEDNANDKGKEPIKNIKGNLFMKIFHKLKPIISQVRHYVRHSTLGLLLWCEWEFPLHSKIWIVCDTSLPRCTSGGQFTKSISPFYALLITPCYCPLGHQPSQKRLGGTVLWTE